MVTIVQPQGEHAGVHGLGHQLRVAVDQVLAIQSWRELHLVSGGWRHAHFLSGGVGPGPGGARATPTSRVAPGQTWERRNLVTKLLSEFHDFLYTLIL